MPTAMQALLRRAKSTTLSDSELLAQYIRHLDADAFRAIVERHGNMVLTVCRRGVRNAADVDDLFQATFLLLAKSAQRIRQPNALAAWLHGTARRLVLQWQKQQYREIPSSQKRFTTDPQKEASWHEVRQLLDDELSKLPLRLRNPLVLCYLEGLSGINAANRLGTSLRTLRRDLESGRLLLRERLTQRGFTHLTLVSVLAASSGLQALPPHELIDLTLTHLASWQTGVPLSASLQALLVTSGASFIAPLMSLMLLTGLTTLLFYWTNQAAAPLPSPVSPIPMKIQQPAARVDSYGDPLPDGILARLGTIRFRHGSPVYAMTFSHDGNRLYTGSNDGTLRCSAFPSGKVLWSVIMPTVARNGHEAVVAMALSSDNKTIAAAAMNDTVHLLDAHTGQFLKQMGKSSDRSSYLGFSSDGKSLFTLSNRDPFSFQQYDLATGKVVAQESLKDLFDIGAFTRSIHLGCGQFKDRLVLTDQQNQIVVFNMLTRKVERLVASHPARIQDILWSTDGTFWLTYDESNTLRRWDVASGQVQWSSQSSISRKNIRLCQAGSGDTSRVIVVNEGEIRVLDAKTGRNEQRIDKPNHMYALSSNSDGTVLAVAGSRGDLAFIDLASGKNLSTVPIPPFKESLLWSDYSPDGKLLLTGGVWDPVMIWDIATRKMTQQLDFKGKAQFLDNQRIVAAGWNQGGLTVWQIQPLQKVHAFDETVLRPLTGIRSLDISHDAKNVIVTGDKRSIGRPKLSMWNTTTGILVKSFDKVEGSPLRVAYSPDGNLIALIDYERQLTLCDAKTGAILHQEAIPGEQGGAIVFSPNSQLLAWSTGNQHIRIMEVATFTNRVTIDNRGDPLDALAFSSDGRSLIWGGQHWPTIYVYDPLTGQERSQLRQHLGPITHLRFAPDGHSFASTSQDATVLLWDWHQYQARRGSAEESLKEDEREVLFKELIGQDASHSWKALERLLRSPTQSLAWIEKHLIKVPTVENKQLHQWIAELASPSFALRDNASRQLQVYLEHAEPLLRQAAADQLSAEVKIRLGQLLDEYQHVYLLKDRLGELLDSLDTPQAQRLKQVLPVSKLKLQ